MAVAKSTWRLPTTAELPRWVTATSPFPVGDGNWAITFQADYAGTGTQRLLSVEVDANTYVRVEFAAAVPSGIGLRITVRDGSVTDSATTTAITVPIDGHQTFAVGRIGNDIFALVYQPNQVDGTPWVYATQTLDAGQNRDHNAAFSATGLSFNAAANQHCKNMGPISWLDGSAVPDVTTDAGKQQLLLYAISPELAEEVATHQWGTIWVDGEERANVDYLDDGVIATLSDTWELRDTIGSLHATLTGSGATVTIDVFPWYTPVPGLTAGSKHMLPVETVWSKAVPLGVHRNDQWWISDNMWNAGPAKGQALAPYDVPTILGTPTGRAGWGLPIVMGYEAAGALAALHSTTVFAHEFHSAIVPISTGNSTFQAIYNGHSEISGTDVQTISVSAEIDLDDISTIFSLPTTEDRVDLNGSVSTGNAFTYCAVAKVGSRIFSFHRSGTGATADLVCWCSTDDGPAIQLVSGASGIAPVPIGAWETRLGQLIVVYRCREGTSTATYHTSALICVDPANWSDYASWRQLDGTALTAAVSAALTTDALLLHDAADAADGSPLDECHSQVAGDNAGNIFLVICKDPTSGDDELKLVHTYWDGTSATRTSHSLDSFNIADVSDAPRIVRLTHNVFGIFSVTQSGTPDFVLQTRSAGVSLRQFNFHVNNPAGIDEVLTNVPTKISSADCFRIDSLGRPDQATGGVVLVGNYMDEQTTDRARAIVERRLWLVNTDADAGEDSMEPALTSVFYPIFGNLALV